MSKGIHRFGSDAGFFEVLRSFAKNTPGLLDQLRGITEQTLADYTVIVHGIKGSCLGICADDLGARAEQLELAAKANDVAFVSEHNGEFILAAEKLIDEISDLLQNLAAQNPKPVKPEPDVDILASLLEACTAYDIDGVDKAMNELESCEYEARADLVGWLREKVTIMGFEEIVERLSHIG
jgi:HPt (histidine-containing phosphotransfer) domain-containing protein